MTEGQRQAIIGLASMGQSNDQIATIVGLEIGEVASVTGGGSFPDAQLVLPGGSGGSVKRAWFNGRSSASSVPAGLGPGFALPWIHSEGETDILDLTDPTAPTVVAAGILAVTINIVCPDLTDLTGHSMFMEMDLDELGDDATASAVVPLGVTDLVGNIDPQGSLACTYFVPTGGLVHVYIGHEITSPTDFFLEAAVQWQAATAEH